MLRFIVLQDARFSPSTSLAAAEAFFTIENDDPERPEDTVVFYNFDGAATLVFDANLQIIGVDYAFTAQPIFAGRPAGRR